MCKKDETAPHQKSSFCTMSKEVEKRLLQNIYLMLDLLRLL